MDQVFTALDRRQAMLLLTTVAFGGQESLPGFAHLCPEEGALLRHRAEQLLQIPREKRIPLLIHELKRRMNAQRSQLLSADPQALAALLASERQAVAEVVLRALPATLAEQVRALLPPITVKLTREVRPDVINSVRWKLEARLAQMASHLPLRFVDVLLLEPRDHYGLCDRLGARALAAAVEGLESEVKQAFLEGVTPDQSLLLVAAMDVVRARPLPAEEAAELVALHQGDGVPADAIRSAGAQRLARACIAQSPELAARLLEKHRGSFGTAFMHWVREERTKARPGDGGRTDVLAEMEAMVQEGVAERPVRAPPRKIQSSTPPPARAAAAGAEPRSLTSQREPRVNSSDEVPVRRPSRIEPVAGEPSARSPLTAPPRMLSSERAIALPPSPADVVPSRVGGEDSRPPSLVAVPRRSMTGEGPEPRSTSGEFRPRQVTGEVRGVPSRGPVGPPRARPGAPQERPSREERVGAMQERPSREERMGGPGMERPSREERVGALQERPSREERMGGPGMERPSREERVGAMQERPSREERVGGPGIERPSREERVAAMPERPSREERMGGPGMDRPSREERVGTMQERPSREERVGGTGMERPSREERVGALQERPSREERVTGSGAPRPSREDRVGGLERPREERSPASAGPLAGRPERAQERPARDERGSPSLERPARADRPAPPEARRGVPEARSNLGPKPDAVRPGREAGRPPREAAGGPKAGGALAERPNRPDGAAPRAAPPPNRPRPGPPVPDEAVPRAAASTPGVAEQSRGPRAAREPDPRIRSTRETAGAARPPRPGPPVPGASEGRARPPGATAGNGRPERGAAAARASGPVPAHRDPAPERVVRPGGGTPERRGEGARGEGRAPRPAQVPGRPSRKME